MLSSRYAAHDEATKNIMKKSAELSRKTVCNGNRNRRLKNSQGQRIGDEIILPRGRAASVAGT